MRRRARSRGDELFAAYLAAIGERDPELHAYLHVVDDDPGGDGIPIAIKDVIGTKGDSHDSRLEDARELRPGLRRHGDRALQGARLAHPRQDEHRRVRDGLVDRELRLRPVAQPVGSDTSPRRLGRRQRGGCLWWVAPWALGSDTGGSIKQPAALCGNVGLRPTYGTVSRYGVVAFASSLDQVGPVAKNVRDCAFLYSIISGRDANDTTTVDVPAVELPAAEDLKGLRIGVPTEMNEADGIEPGVSDSVRKALEQAEQLGAQVGECSLPRSVAYGVACYYLISPAEASSNLARYDGARYGLRSDGDDFREMVMATRRDGFGDEPKRRIMIGTYALSSGYYDAYYGTAQKVRTMIRREHDEVFRDFDVIVSPTSPTVAFPIGEKVGNPLAMYLNDLLTIPSCMAGLPGLSIPCGLSEGLPVGLQLIGPQFSENTLFRAGHALERALGFDVVPTRLR